MDCAEVNNWELLVVLPGGASADEQHEIARLGGIPILRMPTDSFGDAMRSGFQGISSESEWTVTMDADGSHDPETLVALLSVADEADIAVASRYVRGGSTDNSLVLRMMSRTLNFAYGLVLGIRCKDVSTNFKRYRSSDVRQLKLSSRDFDVVEEIFYRIKLQYRDQLVIEEIPDHFRERNFGKTKRQLGPFVVSYLRTLYKLRRELR